MADVELIIKIQEDVYKDIIAHDRENREGAKSAYYFEGLIQNGKILPKGHGDLIDISKLPVTTTYFGINDKPIKVVNYNCILNTKKIIKADKVESEG